MARAMAPVWSAAAVEKRHSFEGSDAATPCDYSLATGPLGQVSFGLSRFVFVFYTVCFLLSDLSSLFSSHGFCPMLIVFRSHYCY